MDAQILLERLEKVKQAGRDRWMACCPAHDDKTPSLQITQANDRILIHCFAQCGAAAVLDAVDLKFSDLYPEDQEYTTRPKYKKPNLEDHYFIEIYKSQVRRGEKPSVEDTQRYMNIIQRGAA